MSEGADYGSWYCMRGYIYNLDCKGWMDLAQSVSDMLVDYDDKCVNLSIDNILYDKKTKTCSLADEAEVEHEGDPIKLRWYPPHVWNAWNEMFYFYDRIAALVVLELMYGTSPFYHKDEAQFRANIRDQFRTVGPTNCRNLRERSPMIDLADYGTRKAIWMLTYTFRASGLLDAGLRCLDTCKRCFRETEERIIRKWDYLSRDWGITTKPKPQESSSGTPSPSKGNDKAELRPELGEDVEGSEESFLGDYASDSESSIS